MIAERMTGSELALELHVPLAAPDALAKVLFGVCVHSLTAEQLEVLTAHLSDESWIALI